jgi:hypothetical protein
MQTVSYPFAVVILLGSFAAFAAGQETKRDETLRQELLDRMSKDQQVRHKLIQYLQTQKNADWDNFKKSDYPLAIAVRDVDRNNIVRMKEIVSHYGWPGVALVGKNGEQAAWLLTQHADQDLAFQEQCLNLLTVAVENGQAPAEQIAYLTDRIRVAKGQKQLYGTQLEIVASRIEPYPIEDEAKVDVRRKTVGLPPLSEYQKTTQTVYATTRKAANP